MLKKKAVKKPSMPYNERIRRYNEEKQSALLMATTQEEVDGIIRILRKKWAV
jgi:hypothetical protein